MADVTSEEDDLAGPPHCRRQDNSLPAPLDAVGLPIALEFDRGPRYRLCPAMNRDFYGRPFGLKIPRSGPAQKGDEYVGQLAYFSNRGSIDVGQNINSDEKVTTAIVAIHGAHRVAANYMCSMIRAVMDHASGDAGESQRLSIQD
jgi:hypothetical protein